MTQLNINLPPNIDQRDFDEWISQVTQYLRDYLGLYDSGTQVSFIQSGTGAISRTVQSKLAETLRVFEVKFVNVVVAPFVPCLQSELAPPIAIVLYS
jgi:hypothetical protein